MALTILPGPLLRERTTIRLGGRAQAEVVVRSEEDLCELPAVLRRLTGDGAGLFVLGRGSNVVALDGDETGGELPVVLLSPGMAGEPELLGEADGEAVVHAPAGLSLPKLLGWLRGRGLSGLEPLTGVPGGVGGAVFMNAGSYGVQFADRLRRVRVWSPSGGARWLERGQWTSGYRSFAPSSSNLLRNEKTNEEFSPELFPGTTGNESGKETEEMFLVLEAEIQLARRAPEEVGAAMRDFLARKKASQPVTAASAGCCFKNPPAESAGRLLESAGFRGKRLGSMAFSEAHANFLVNLGGGTSRQAFELIDEARRAVLERFGIELHLEVKLCPCR